MPLLQFKVHADYDEVMRLRGEIEKLEDTLKNFGPGTTESTIKSIQNQLIEARKRFSELIQEAAKAGAEVEQSIRNSLQKTKDKGNINITVKADTSDFHKKNEKLLRDVDKSLRELEAYGEKASSTLQSVSQMAGLTLAGMGFVEFADKIKEVRGQFQQYEVAFKTMLGSAEKAQDLMQQLTQTAAITPFDLQGVTQGAKQLLAYGISADEVNQKLIQLGDIAAGLSLPLSDLVYLYGTTIAQGRMFTQDLRQFMGRGIPLAAELAKQFGVAESKVGELVTAGKVTAKEFNAAIESMSAAGGQFGGLMEAQSQTILGQISNIGDAIDSMFNDLGKSSEGVINATLSGVSYMVEHYEQFGRILMGVVATYGTYKTALMLVAAAKGWATAAEALHYNWLLLVEKAQKMLNATMLNNPYVLVATLIAGVVTAMISMKTEAERIKEAEEEYEAQLQKTIDAEDEHRRKMEELCSVAGDEALSTDTRREALYELEKKYPDIFAKYDTEYEKLKNIKKIKEEIAELDGAKSIRQTKNELSSVNSRIDELEQKKATQHNELRFGKLRRVGGLTKAEEAELANLYGKRTELQKKSAKDDADKYIKDAINISDSMLEAEIKARRGLIAKLKTSGGTSGRINGGGASGDYTLDELQYQLNKLTDEQNRRNAKKDSSADWGKAAKDKYDKALKAYNDFVNNKTNSLSQEEYERKAQELKDALDIAKKEYEKYKPATDKKGKGGKKDDPKQRAYEAHQAELQETRRLEELRLEEEQRLEDLRIARMRDGSDKEIATIHNEAKKKRDALDSELQREIDRLKKYDLQQWLKGGKDRKAYDWVSSKSDEDYATEAEQNLGISTRLVEIAMEESQSLQSIYKSDLVAMRDYLRDYGTFNQRKLAIAKDYDARMRDATSEGQRLSLQKEKDKALRQVETEAISAKIDWYSVFDNLGFVMRGQLEPLYNQLKAYVTTEAFKTSDASSQRAIVDAMENLRTQLGDNGQWKDLSTALTDYQNAIQRLNATIEQNNIVTEEANRLQSVYDDALQTLDNLSRDENATPLQIQEAQKAVEDAKAAMDGYAQTVANSNMAMQDAQNEVSATGMVLSQSAKSVTKPINKIYTFLNNYGLPQLAELWHQFDLIKGGLDGLTALKKASKEAADAGKEVSEAGKKVGEGANGVAKELKDKVSDKVIEGLDAAGLIGQIVSAVMSILEILGDGIGTFISNIIDSVLSNITGILDNLLSGEFAIQIGESLVKGIGGIFKSITTMGGLFDWWGNGESDPKLEEDIERLTLTNETLRKAIEDLTDEMKDASIADAADLYLRTKDDINASMRNTQEMMQRSGAAYSNGFLGIGGKHSSNNKINNGMTAADWNRISKAAGVSVKSASDFWNLTSEQMAKVAKETPDLYAKIKGLADDGYKDAAQFMDEYIEYWKELEELRNAYWQSLTDTNFDSVKDAFKSTLLDMESSTEDFAQSFEAMMRQAVINSLMTSKYNKLLEDWYEEFAKAMEGDGLSDDEQRRLKKKYDAIVSDAIADREAVAKAMGWDTSTTQQASSRALQGMTQDTAEAIEGRMTAMQIAVETIRATHQIEAASIAELNDSMLAMLQTEKGYAIFYENLERQVAKIYLEVQGINENTGAIVRPIQNMEIATNEIMRKIKNL